MKMKPPRTGAHKPAPVKASEPSIPVSSEIASEAPVAALLSEGLNHTPQAQNAATEPARDLKRGSDGRYRDEKGHAVPFEEAEPEKYAQIVELMRQGHNNQELTAAVEGLKIGTISRIRRKEGIPAPGNLGRNLPQKLEQSSPEEFQQVVELLKDGKTHKEITAEMGVCGKVISRIYHTYKQEYGFPDHKTMTIEERDPEKFNQICMAFTAGYTPEMISERFKISADTARRIRATHGHKFPEWQTAAACSLKHLSLQLARSLSEDVEQDRLSPNSKAFAISVMAEKSMLLQGQATSITETVNSSRVTTVNDALKSLDVIDAEVVTEEKIEN